LVDSGDLMLLESCPYEQFRPKIPEGVSGWGAKGELDWVLIRQLAAQE
jgi:hypothetical protein